MPRQQMRPRAWASLLGGLATSFSLTAPRLTADSYIPNLSIYSESFKADRVINANHAFFYTLPLLSPYLSLSLYLHFAWAGALPSLLLFGSS